VCHAGNHGIILAESKIRACDLFADLDTLFTSPYCTIEGEGGGVSAPHSLIDPLTSDWVCGLCRVTQEDNPVKLAVLGGEIASKRTTDRSPGGIKVA
jgi:hypothetical protein